MALNYPINVKTDRFDVYDLSAQKIIRYDRKWPESNGMPLNEEDENTVLLLRVSEALPIGISNDTHAITKNATPSIDLDAQTSTYGYSVTERSLDEVKDNVKQAIKEERDALLTGGFDFGGKHFQTRNDADKINITGVGLAAMAANAAGQQFSVNFRATDNSVVTMDGTVAQSFYMTMVVTAQSIWTVYNTKYQAVEEASTVQEALDVLN